MQSNKENRDRFISNSKIHPNEYYSYKYEPIDKFSINGRYAHLDTDSQLVKMYKNILLETHSNKIVSPQTKSRYPYK